MHHLCWSAKPPLNTSRRRRRRSSIATKTSTLLQNGIPIKSTLDNSSTVQYAGNVHQLLMKARGMVRDIDPQNDLTFLRVRSKKNEIMIAPDKDYFLIVIQNPTE
uniref:Dynein, light chain, roadblock-type 1 n=1 Tax=Cyprinus carpio carpio TaxID=630221 RepID=A0A9J8AUV9_CYPCA